MFRTWLLSGHYNSQCNSPGPGGWTHSPPLKVLSNMTSETLREGGAFSQACKGFAGVRLVPSHRTASVEARVQIPTNSAAASAARPALHAILLLSVHCSPGKFSKQMG